MYESDAKIPPHIYGVRNTMTLTELCSIFVVVFAFATLVLKVVKVARRNEDMGEGVGRNLPPQTN